MMIDKRANDTAADFVKRKIRSIVKDPKTAAILSNIDHPYAAKRPPIDTNYFETYNRPNVRLGDRTRHGDAVARVRRRHHQHRPDSAYRSAGHLEVIFVEDDHAQRFHPPRRQ
jgi:hypothetical protein